MNEVTIKKKVNFIMLMGSSLHKYGASSDRIEKALTLTANKLNLHGDFFATPTTLFACFKINEEHSETRLVRLQVGKVNLTKLLMVDETVDEILDDELKVLEGSRQINSVLTDEPKYKGFVVNIAYALISFGIALFLGGSIADAVTSGATGFMIGVFTENIKLERLSSISEGILSFLAAFSSILLSHYGPFDIHPQVVTVASLIILIPGLMLTTSIGELASNNLTSGTARLLGAIMILLKISFGVYLAHLITRSMGIIPMDFLPNKHPLLYLTPMVTLTALGFVISFQARFKEYLWICMACILTFLCSRLTMMTTDFAISAFISGAFIASFSNFFSRVSNKPALITLLPGITLLVPGSIGYHGIESMINQNTIEGIDTILRTFLIAVALVSGTFFGSILIKPKRALDI